MLGQCVSFPHPHFLKNYLSTSRAFFIANYFSERDYFMVSCSCHQSDLGLLPSYSWGERTSPLKGKLIFIKSHAYPSLETPVHSTRTLRAIHDGPLTVIHREMGIRDESSEP